MKKSILLLLITFAIMIPITVNADSINLYIECDDDELGADETSICTVYGDYSKQNSLNEFGVKQLTFTLDEKAEEMSNLSIIDVSVANSSWKLAKSPWKNSDPIIVTANDNENRGFAIVKFTVKASPVKVDSTAYINIKDAKYSDANNANLTFSNVKGKSISLKEATTLKSISVEGFPFKFNPTLFSYNIDVPSSQEKIKILAETYTSDQKCEGTGEHTLKYGKNTFEIRVTTSGTTSVTQTYYLVVNRNRDETKEANPSTGDSTLYLIGGIGVLLCIGAISLKKAKTIK